MMTVQSGPVTRYKEDMANEDNDVMPAPSQADLVSQTPLPVPYFGEGDMRFVEIHDEAEMFGRARWGHD
jgi:hypothetical protein